MNKILVVDDDKNILKIIKMRLEAKDFLVVCTMQEEEAAKLVKEEIFDLAIVDFKLEKESGIELMETLHEVCPELPVIILTAYGTINNAVDSMKRGAYSYLTKPFDYQELLLQINNALEKQRLTKEVKMLKEMVNDMYGSENIIGKSDEMKKVFEHVVLAAKTDSTVYICGESGTGKELIAKNLHVASPRRDMPFVAINCSAVPEALIESELFGYEKGAFTGAVSAKKGMFLQADKGTFFMDEVSEMPLTMQAKILRVLEEKEFYPLGSEKIVKVDVRIVVASNKNLEEEVKRGNFREDLFYRIHVIRIKLPPLRDRKGDVLLLAKYFLEKYAKKMDKKIKGFTPSASQKLMMYHWPGNVRELENAVECAIAMTIDDVITEDLILSAQETGTKKNDLKPLRNAKEEFERDYLVQLFEITNGNVSRAAKLSGKYRADIYELIKKYDLKPAEYRNSSV